MRNNIVGAEDPLEEAMSNKQSVICSGNIKAKQSVL